MDIALKYFEEAYTTEHWMVRIYRVLDKRAPLSTALPCPPRRRTHQNLGARGPCVLQAQEHAAMPSSLACPIPSIQKWVFTVHPEVPEESAHHCLMGARHTLHQGAAASGTGYRVG
jgi:hypothetical protein